MKAKQITALRVGTQKWVCNVFDSTNGKT